VPFVTFVVKTVFVIFVAIGIDCYMLRGIFVTGTDTNVGKTVVSAALLRRYRDEAPVRYWKPIQTGIEQDDDSAEVARLAGCDRILSCGVRLKGQVSPHLAARLSGTRIAIPPLVELLHEADVNIRPAAARWIVEGAGGALVPLNESDMVADLIVALALPVLIVARSTLGTINHTVLTIEALRRRALHVAGVVMVGPPDDENRVAIERYGAAEVVAEMPHFDPLTPDRLAAWVSSRFDRNGTLLRYLE
jgi:dethiobiotin synthetase